MKARIHELRFRGDPFGLVHRTFERPGREAELVVGWPADRREYPADASATAVELPAGARLVQRSQNGVVVQCELGGKVVQLEAGEVFALARLGLEGFRLAAKPGTVGDA